MVKKLFKIGEVMENSGLSRQVIHNHTQLELIHEAKRTSSGHRLYGKEVFTRLKKIKRLQSKGKTLLEIKKILNKRR
jgi:DNA-binding transcriptional MerR regulator